MKKIRLLVLLSMLPFFCEASSHTSGYISVKYVSGNTYQATIVDYTIGDTQNSGFCDAGTDIDTLRIWWGDGESELLTRSNGNGDSVCSCRKENIYTATHTYSSPGTYHLWYDALSRAADICNIGVSANTDMYIYYALSILPSGNSLLPVITNPPGCDYACTSDCYYYNPDVSVPAGDSVSYSLGSCLSSGAVAPGYYNPGATIDSVTGLLSWCNPSSDCLWNFAITMVTFQPAFINFGGNYIRVMYAIDTEEIELEVNVQSNCALGLNEPKATSEQVGVYPNPSNGLFTIQSLVASGQLSVEVYNVLGEEVYNATLKQVQGDNSINLSNQPNGIYLYRVLTENGGLTGEGKLIIQK